MDRRLFLTRSVQVLGIGGLAYWVGQASFSQSMGKLIGTQIDFRVPEGKDNHEFFRYLWIHDLDKKRKKMIPMKFAGHGFALNENSLFIVQKWGSHFAKFNLESEIFEKEWTSRPDREFFGHAACDNSQNLIYVTEVIRDEAYEAGRAGAAKGIFSVRDQKTLLVQREIETHGTAPHDCHLVDGNSMIIVANTGRTHKGVHGKGSLAFVDTKSGKLMEKLEMPDQNLHLSHFVVSKEIHIFAGSVGTEDGRPGSICHYTPKRGLAVLPYPDSMTTPPKGEVLSVAIDAEAKVGCATNPEAGLVTFWDLESRKLMKYVAMKRPQGVSLSENGKYFVVTSAGENAPSLRFFSVANLAEEAPFLYTDKIHGSHTFVVES